MFARVKRLFSIRTKFEAYLVIYALATGAVERGFHYMTLFPGTGGMLLFAVCPIAVVVAGGHILDTLDG